MMGDEFGRSFRRRTAAVAPQSGELGGERRRNRNGCQGPGHVKSPSRTYRPTIQPIVRTVKAIIRYYPSPRITMICLRCEQPIQQVGVEATSSFRCGCPRGSFIRRA